MDKLINKSSIFPFVLLGIWALLRISFYEYIGFEAYFQLFDALNKVLTLLIVASCLSEIDFKYDKISSLIAYGFFFTILFNIIIYHSNIQQEITGFTPILGFYSFFLLKKFNLSSEQIERFLLLFALVYLFLWCIAIYNVPKLIFGQNLSVDLSNTDRGFFRLWIPDKEHFPILLYFFLGRFLSNKKYYYVPFAFTVLIVVILHVGRQMIMWSMISALLMILAVLKRHRVRLLLGIAALYILAQWLFANIEGISLMLDMTEKQTSNIEDDIRTLAIKYFLFDFPNNPFSIIFGNGIPCEGTDLRSYIDLAFNKGFFLEDVGFVGMYIRYGLWMVVLMIVLLIKVFHMQVDSRYLYLKFYILYIYGMYLFGHALTTDIFYVMMAYFILVKSNKEINENKNSLRINKL